MLLDSTYCRTSSTVGVHASSSLAIRFLPFSGVTGSGMMLGGGVTMRCCPDPSDLDCCSSDPKKVIVADAAASDAESEVISGVATVKSPEGAGIDFVTVAGEANVASFVANRGA